ERVDLVDELSRRAARLLDVVTAGFRAQRGAAGGVFAIELLDPRERDFGIRRKRVELPSELGLREGGQEGVCAEEVLVVLRAEGAPQRIATITKVEGRSLGGAAQDGREELTNARAACFGGCAVERARRAELMPEAECPERAHASNVHRERGP